MSTPSSKPLPINIPPEVTQAATDILRICPPTSSFTPLEEISSDRYLGVILDKDLSFNPHVDEITKKASKLLNLCRRNLYMCDASIKEAAYKSLVRPHLEYASPAWSPHTSRNIDKVEAVQRRAARFVMSYYEYGPNVNLSDLITNNLKWQSLQHRRAQYDLSLFYKIRTGQLNISFPPYVTPSPVHPDRYTHIQALHSEAFKYHFYVRTVRLWNILPSGIRDSPTVDCFKSKVGTWIAPLAWVRTQSTWTLQ